MSPSVLCFLPLRTPTDCEFSLTVLRGSTAICQLSNDHQDRETVYQRADSLRISGGKKSPGILDIARRRVHRRIYLPLGISSLPVGQVINSTVLRDLSNFSYSTNKGGFYWYQFARSLFDLHDYFATC